MLSMNELVNLQYEDQLYLWGRSHPVGKFPNMKTKQPPSSPRSAPQSLLLFKKKKRPTLWCEPLEILWLFNYSVSCLLVILIDPCYNIDSYFWRPDQTRLIIWSGLLHNTHHSVSPSDLWIKPCTLWEIQGIFVSKFWRIYHILG